MAKNQWDARENNHDIALMITLTPFKLTDYIRPVCLPTADFSIESGLECVISGWGSTEKRSTASIRLKYSTIQMFDQNTCEQRVRHPVVYWRQMMTPTGICGGGNGTDTCKGDSGGPLVCRIQESVRHAPRYILAGVTSWGFGCGKTPGVYTEVKQYIQWIYKMITN